MTATFTVAFRVTRSADGAHVTMAHETAHEEFGYDCWCKPRFYLPCSECEDGRDTCWRCGTGGLIELSREQAGKADAPLVIVHS